MKKSLGIYEDAAYSYKLMQRLNQSDRSGFLVYGFSQREGVEGFLEKRPLDVLLVGEDYYEEYLKTADVGQVIFLMEEDVGRGNNCIYKYQSAEEILSQVSALLGRRESLSGTTGSAVELMGVCSGLSLGCGQELSLEFARKLSARRQVLHVSLRAFAALEEDAEQAGNSLTDLMYFLEQGKLDETFRRLLVKEGNLYRLIPMEYPTDLRQVELESWQELFDGIGRSGIVDLVVVEFDECVSCHEWLLEECSRIFVPVVREHWAERRAALLESFVRKTLPEAVMDRMVKLRVPTAAVGERGFVSRMADVMQGALTEHES